MASALKWSHYHILQRGEERRGEGKAPLALNSIHSPCHRAAAVFDAACVCMTAPIVGDRRSVGQAWRPLLRSQNIAWGRVDRKPQACASCQRSKVICMATHHRAVRPSRDGQLGWESLCYFYCVIMLYNKA